MTIRLSSAVAAASIIPLLASCGGRTRPGAPQSQAATAVAAAPVAAPDSAELFPAALLAQVADRLAQGTSTGQTVGEGKDRKYIVGRRTASGQPEAHDRWMDVQLIQAGRATLVSGGRIDGATIDAQGEHHGGAIVGGSSRPVGPGDLLIVPAGVPHQYLLEKGDSLRYLTIKIAQTP